LKIQDRGLKFWCVKSSRWQTAAILKNKMVAISRQWFGWLPWYLVQWCTLPLWTVLAVKVSKFKQVQDGGWTPFGKLLNRHISTRVWLLNIMLRLLFCLIKPQILWNKTGISFF